MRPREKSQPQKMDCWIRITVCGDTVLLRGMELLKGCRHRPVLSY
jgi:hypothetical protein